MDGSIRQVGSQRWRLVFDGPPHPDGGRRQITRTVTAASRTAAKEQLRKLIVEAGKVDARVEMTVAELVARWIRHTEHELAARTLDSRRRTWRLHVEPRLGDMPVGDVGPADLNDLYLAMREHPYKPATVIKAHALISGAFAYAVEEGWVAQNPAARARRPKQHKGEPRIPDPAKVVAALAEADRRWPEFGVLVRLLATTGLRRGEVCALRWTDVDLDTQVLHVRRSMAATAGVLSEKPTKTDRPRRVSIGPAMAARLRQHRTRVASKRLELGAAIPADGYVFPWTLGADRPMHPSTVTHRWMVCRDAVGAPSIRLHDLRHHTASQLVAENTNLQTVMERHGWTSLATAQRYIHTVDAKDAAAAEVLERILGESS